MTITTRHSASCYGLPVALDASGQPMAYPAALKSARAELGLSVPAIASLCDVSPRTWEYWEQGRGLPGAAAMNVLRDALEDKMGANITH